LSDPPQISTRIETIYRHARNAIYASLDAAVIRDCCQRHIDVATNSADREDYLAHPATGESIAGKDTFILERLLAGSVTPPEVQFAISDGLNADAINENLRNFLPKLKWELKESGFLLSDTDVIIRNGRVRAGYHVAQICKPVILIHLIGERPGTGLNQLSVYMTYGKDPAGNFRWSPQMDHSFTTAICSIHPKGKTTDSAVSDIIKCVRRMTELQCSGVLLGKE
jgi:ethanolamine ammonia-lyase large subunit